MDYDILEIINMLKDKFKHNLKDTVIEHYLVDFREIVQEAEAQEIRPVNFHPVVDKITVEEALDILVAETQWDETVIFFEKIEFYVFENFDKEALDSYVENLKRSILMKHIEEIENGAEYSFKITKEYYTENQLEEYYLMGELTDVYDMMQLKPYRLKMVLKIRRNKEN